MTLEGPSRQEQSTQGTSSLPATRTGAMGDHQIVRYDPKIADPFGLQRLSQVFQERTSQLLRRLLETDRYAIQHLRDRGTIFVLIGTSTAGKTSVTRQLAKEAPGLVELGLDDYADLHVAEMDADLLRTHTPELYEAMAPAFAHAEDIAYAIFGDKEPKWKPGISKETLEKAQKALTAAKAIKESFPHVEMENVKARMMEEGMRLSSRGRPVIFDLWQPNDADKFVQHMIDKQYYAPLKRGLAYCPFHVLAERVRKRNIDAMASGHPEDRRDPLIPLDQFPGFYRPAEEGDAIIDTLHRNGADGVEEAFESAFQQRIAMLQPDLAKDTPEEIGRKEKEIATLVSDHDDWKAHILNSLGFSEGVTEVPITLKNKRIDRIFNTHVHKDPREITAIIRAWK